MRQPPERAALTDMSILVNARTGRTPKVRQAMARRNTRLAEASRLRMQGLTILQIARQIGVGDRTIKRYLAILDANWRLRMPHEAEQARLHLEARYAELEAEAKAEWERSKLPAERTEMEREAVQGLKPGEWPVTKVKTVHQGRVGDSSLLAERRRILEDLRKMLGLDIERPAVVTVHGPPVNLFQLILQAQAEPIRVIDADGAEADWRPDTTPRLLGGNGNGEVQKDESL